MSYEEGCLAAAQHLDCNADSMLELREKLLSGASPHVAKRMLAKALYEKAQLLREQARQIRRLASRPKPLGLSQTS